MTPTADSPADGEPAPLALVAGCSHALAGIPAALRAAGISVADAAGAAGAAPDVAVVAVGPDANGADVLAGLSAETAEGTGGHLPVILLASEGMSAEEIAALDVADFLIGPAPEQELVLRIRTLLRRTKQQQRRRESTAQLRQRTRAISAAIRSSNDPQFMAEQVIAGLSETFGADRSWIRTFGDERVPTLEMGWDSDGISASAPALPTEEAERLAAMLWEDERVLAVPDHDGAELPDLESLNKAAGKDGLKTSVVVPLGHGGKAFGLLWLAGIATAREWAPIELSLIQHVAGNLAHGLVQGQLITAQRQVLNRVRELDQAKSEFVATVNHELRTPLSSIIGYLDMIMDDGVGELPHETARMLKIVDRNAHRLNGLVEDVLTLSRSDAGNIQQSIRPVRLSVLLQSVLSTLAPAAAAGRIDLSLREPASDVQVDADQEQLEQVFVNIISNAVKFTPAGGRVAVDISSSVSDAGIPRACVRVRDTGIGIPADEVPKLYGRFFRASNATAAAIQGTGLGLSIVQDLVHQHGGELHISSRLHEGTTVSVQLPARR
ncbi:ATP-binding protein [Arthrobacter sp. VKM Ac-2550]|uniref:ATP-binding response regulator n=1 Tax=Crystallibacter permensis TaxID=1938888 RepID=UPI002227188A|nr:ATP-binding protein [Arthrobacter sp. VKM Ac-2550]MCW2131444.1 GAF domain-containing protein [Arthrobacter sp. VKM Ac-2550]